MLFASHHNTGPREDGVLPLWDIMGRAGLQGNATICLDAGDPLSWAGTGKWMDRTAGGYDFYLGLSSAPESADPAFSGTVGDLTTSTYWNWDQAGDCFSYDAAPEAFMQSWHHDNAAFTMMSLFRLSALPVAWGGLVATVDVTANTDGMVWGVNSSGKLFYRATGAVADIKMVTMDNALSIGWHMVAVSFNESAGAGGAFFHVDGAYAPVSGSDTWNASYSTPSTNSCTGCKIGAELSRYGVMPATTRLMGIATINRACTKAELDAVWALARKRLGI